MNLPRRRLSCVYCGARIEMLRTERGGSISAAMRYARRTACKRHRRLALIERDTVRL